MTDNEPLTPQERHDKLQDVWVALCQLQAHENQDDYELDSPEGVRQRALQHVGEVIGYYHRNESVDTSE